MGNFINALFRKNKILKELRHNQDNYLSLEGDLLVKYQKVLFNITKDIVDICEQENVAYVLGGGTALGAVRHGGFIPWDDDVDINMLRSNYKHFRECFLKKYGAKYEIYDIETSGYYESLIRVCLKNSIYHGYSSRGSEKIYVDIFLIENVPDNSLLKYLHGALCMGMGALHSCRISFAKRKFYMGIAKDNPEFALGIYFSLGLGFLVSFLSLKRWQIILMRCYGICKNNNSRNVTIPPSKAHYFGRLAPRNQMMDTIRIPFEGEQWCVPRDYDSYLKSLYGSDYMTIPPEEKREKHLYTELVFPDEL